MGLNRVGESAGKVKSCLYLHFCVHVGIALNQMTSDFIELFNLLMLAICDSAEM
jgi:hypothetical protein